MAMVVFHRPCCTCHQSCTGLAFRLAMALYSLGRGVCGPTLRLLWSDCSTRKGMQNLYKRDSSTVHSRKQGRPPPTRVTPIAPLAPAVVAR